MKRLNRNMHGDDPVAYRLPAQREQAAQYLLLYEMSLPYGLDLNNQINVKRSATRVTVTLRALSSREMRELDYRIQDWLRANAPPFMHVAGAIPTLMFAHMSERNMHSMTFLVLIIGFSVLTLSPIETNSLFGLMIAITIGAVLFTAFLLLPMLPIQIEGESQEDALSLSVATRSFR